MSDKKYRTVNVTEEGFAKLIKLRNQRSEVTGDNVSLLTAAEYAIDLALEPNINKLEAVVEYEGDDL